MYITSHGMYNGIYTYTYIYITQLTKQCGQIIISGLHKCCLHFLNLYFSWSKPHFYRSNSHMCSKKRKQKQHGNFAASKSQYRPFHTMTFPADRRSDQRRQRMQQLLGEMEEVEEEEVLRGRAQKHRFYHVFPTRIHHLSSVYPSFIL